MTNADGDRTRQMGEQGKCEKEVLRLRLADEIETRMVNVHVSIRLHLRIISISIRSFS